MTQACNERLFVVLNLTDSQRMVSLRSKVLLLKVETQFLEQLRDKLGTNIG